MPVARAAIAVHAGRFVKTRDLPGGLVEHATKPARTTRIDGDRRRADDDLLVREEPLEIRLGPLSLAVVMRTPGHDEELALGFLVTERVIDHRDQVRSIRHCTTVEAPEAEDNVLQVLLAEGVDVDFERLRRNLYASSSCGICGKATIENAMAVAPPLEERGTCDQAWLGGLTDRLLEGQEVFARTGGLHAAALFAPGGSEALVVREDVGRHNAVDKVVGWATSTGLRPAGHALVVSGRISYEIVQKALAARIPLVVAVSAPTSLAVELAETAGITLAGFARRGTMNVYTHPERLAPPSTS